MSLRSVLTRLVPRRRGRAEERARRATAHRPPHASPAEAWGRGGGPIDPGFGA